MCVGRLLGMRYLESSLANMGNSKRALWHLLRLGVGYVLRFLDRI